MKAWNETHKFFICLNTEEKKSVMGLITEKIVLFILPICDFVPCFIPSILILSHPKLLRESTQKANEGGKKSIKCQKSERGSQERFDFVFWNQREKKGKKALLIFDFHKSFRSPNRHHTDLWHDKNESFCHDKAPQKNFLSVFLLQPYIY